MTSDQRAELIRWAEALESGRYQPIAEQLRGRLWDSDGESMGYGHCCLGVYAEELGVEWRDMSPLIYGIDVRRVEEEGEFSEYLARGFFEARTGLTMEQQELLAGMNDEGKTFREIASRIRDFARG